MKFDSERRLPYPQELWLLNERALGDGVARALMKSRIDAARTQDDLDFPM